MPLLFSLGIKGALATVQAQLQEGEYLFAFLDDVYALCPPERVCEIYAALEAALGSEAGIRLHEGKTKVWNKAGVPPVERGGVPDGVGNCVGEGQAAEARRSAEGPGVGDESAEERAKRVVRDAWSPTGVKVLGSPIGSAEFIVQLCNERTDEERVLLDAIPHVPDLQCAWHGAHSN